MGDDDLFEGLSGLEVVCVCFGRQQEQLHLLSISFSLTGLERFSQRIDLIRQVTKWRGKSIVLEDRVINPQVFDLVGLITERALVLHVEALFDASSAEGVAALGDHGVCGKVVADCTHSCLSHTVSPFTHLSRRDTGE